MNLPGPLTLDLLTDFDEYRMVTAHDLQLINLTLIFLAVFAVIGFIISITGIIRKNDQMRLFLILGGWSLAAAMIAGGIPLTVDRVTAKADMEKYQASSARFAAERSEAEKKLRTHFGESLRLVYPPQEKTPVGTAYLDLFDFANERGRFNVFGGLGTGEKEIAAYTDWDASRHCALLASRGLETNDRVPVTIRIGCIEK